MERKYCVLRVYMNLHVKTEVVIVKKNMQINDSVITSNFTEIKIFTRSGLLAGPSHGIDVSVCLLTCPTPYVLSGWMSYSANIPDRDPQYFYRFRTPYKMTIRGAG